MQRRNLGAVLLMLPLAVFLWFIGWSFFWIGSRRTVIKPKRLSDSNELVFMVLMPQEKQARQR